MFREERGRSLALPLALLGSFVALTACSDGEGAAPPTSTPDSSAPAPDQRLPAPDTMAPVADAAPSGCGPGIYPCGPYGKGVGEIIDNLVFQGFADPNFRCQKAGSMAIDGQSPQGLTLGDFHRGGAGCPDKRKRVLWVFVSAGWCHACEVQMKSLVPQYNKGQFDERVELLQVLFEDNQGQPATLDFAKKYIASHGGTHPLVIDPNFDTARYFPINATPLNMLVDLQTMEIFYAENGVNLPALGKAMLDRLKR